jgi:CelD/BcsL family acetyltransferase involved in cellulose biosynthesis
MGLVMAGAALSLADAGVRPPADAARCEIVDVDWLQGRREAWDRLVTEAVTPNPFYAGRIVSAHVAHGLAGRDLRFVAVHRRDRLLALVPFRSSGARLSLWRRAHAGWISPYVVTSTPLIARDGLARHVDALLDGLSAGGSLWLLPLLSLESDAGAALRAGIAARGWPSAVLSAFVRPVLDGRGESAYEAHIGTNRRKDLHRRRRRLAERGRLEVTSFVQGEGLRRAVEDFLALELMGWKGLGGTALASRPNTASFLRAAFADDSGPVACRADMLTLDGRPIAISLAFVCGGASYLFKTAYDETLRRHAPGVLLEDEIVRIRRETGFAESLNSASLPGGLLETLYPHREPMGDLLLATRGYSAHALASLAKQEALRRHATGRLKPLYRRLRAACHPTSAKGRASVEAK